MHGFLRPELPHATEAWLATRQEEVNATEDPDTTAIWKANRPEMNQNGIRAALVQMVGIRERCMFCGDSMASDIEHYRPKSRFSDRMYVWKNLLWVCNPCNKKKGIYFPTSNDGAPLLIDPTSVDPWRHLYYVPETGELTPRLDPITGLPDPSGEATTDPEKMRLNVQAVSTARLRAWRSLRREVEHFLADPDDATLRLLVEAFEDTERPDVALWVMFHEGQCVQPFLRFHRERPDVALHVQERLRNKHVCGMRC